jgi:predicted nuclease of restriction endonuclease-like (RecB) superfamily
MSLISYSGNDNNLEKQFFEISEMIQQSRYNALKSVNRELINLYWQIGEYISRRVESEKWGKGIVRNLADFLNKTLPDTKGFSSQNLWRMKQFYEAYKDDQILSPLARELSWTHNIIILSKTKSPEEKEFYLRLTLKENYSKRDLERQIDSGLFERVMLSDKKISTTLTQIPRDVSSVFKDTYIFDFLNLPDEFSEKDLQKAIIQNLKHFILEFGRDFAFVGEEYRLQVGSSDFFIDLLFYHRDLCCLVALELKIDDFKPEYVGKMNFYLEALDRDVKKAHENPSVGIILCKDKDNEIVE